MEVREIRRLNAVYLAEKKYSRAMLSSKLGYSDNNYVNQLTGGHSTIGDRTARRFEEKLNLSSGWMDAPHPELWGETPEEIAGYAEKLLSGLSNAELSRLIDKALKIIQARED